MSMAGWPQGERPKEKLFNKGVASLSDAELLAVILQTGTPGRTSLDIARDMLSAMGACPVSWQPIALASLRTLESVELRLHDSWQ